MSEKRLLIIDDEPDIGRFISEVAEEMGFEVVTTETADAFKKALDSFDPTLIMLDIVMPDTDGIELLRYLAEMECKTRIIVMTGYSGAYLESAETIGDHKGLNRVESLTKPIPLAKLREALGD